MGIIACVSVQVMLVCCELSASYFWFPYSLPLFSPFAMPTSYQSFRTLPHITDTIFFAISQQNRLDDMYFLVLPTINNLSAILAVHVWVVYEQRF